MYTIDFLNYMKKIWMSVTTTATKSPTCYGNKSIERVISDGPNGVCRPLHAVPLHKVLDQPSYLQNIVSPPSLIFFTSRRLRCLKLLTVIIILFPAISSTLLFHTKTRCRACVRTDITCSHAHDLEASGFSTFWLRRNCNSH